MLQKKAVRIDEVRNLLRDDILKIVVTNDDGIYTPGIWTLAEALARVGEVIVVAPDREQRGVG